MTAVTVAERPGSRALAWLTAAALAVLAVIAIDSWRDRRSTVEIPLDPAELSPSLGPRTYAEALAGAERAIAGARQQVARNPGEWLHMEVLARALMARYRLTASPQDLVEADRLLSDALHAAPYPAGPNLSMAGVALTGHDLRTAEAALERLEASAVPPSEVEQLDARSIRCEIAFQRGRLAEAERLCSGADDLGLRLRLANIAAKRGDTDEAAETIEALMRRSGLSPPALGQLMLQRASVALGEGDWEASGRWARAAERVFPGYWLSEAYVAQQYAIEGNRAEARRRYAALADRTGNPDVMHALARLADADGLTAEAQRWAARATAAWKARIRQSPFAYAGHYSEHLLLYGDSRAALDLAAGDYRRRPYPATAVHFAFALWRNGDPARALGVVRETEAQGFRTADIKLAEAVSLAALGRAAEAGEAMDEARGLNPRIDSLRQQFVVFGQD